MIKKIKKLIPGKTKKKLILFFHRGNRYVCPFCNYSSRDLSTIGIDSQIIIEKHIIGGGVRPGGCYNCGSIDRERLLYIYLKEKLKLFSNGKNKSILHLAPEKNLSNKILEFGFTEYICTVYGFPEGTVYPKHVMEMNVLNIPFEDKHFDLILCNHVLEHITKDIDAMKELYRVLKPCGRAILQVPISKNSQKTFEDFSITTEEDKLKAFGQIDHVRIYGQDYTDRLKSVGFKVERINISNEFSKYGLNKEEDIFTATME
jgi:SAM-dependent methyltransferase